MKFDSKMLYPLLGFLGKQQPGHESFIHSGSVPDPKPGSRAGSGQENRWMKHW